ncbi:MAG TPA: ATP-dependent sacrificial sulfur transferase LarE, partial [Dehalococcoidia bacterium]|nr:ATP-dependent sacrificial sulfur transferase LarE [Dehalococcoidia bacterium]
ELENPNFVANPPDRCYHCKLELFHKLKGIAEEEGLRNIVDGSNCEDSSDYRPGRRAAIELGVRHPLQEAKLTKDEIRLLSKEMGLPTWNKPSLACLASRFPYGTPITKESLVVVDEAENFLHSLGIGQLRVRHYNKTARIEVEPQDMDLLLEGKSRYRILVRFKELGYLYVTLDLVGYRTGSLNEGLVRGLQESSQHSPGAYKSGLR